MTRTTGLEMVERLKMSTELKIEYIPIDTLKPFVDNPREHSERNINDIKQSISRFGFTNPILVRREDNMIIAGHGRIEAAAIEGLDTVPVIYLDMSDNDAKLYSITDNRTAETSEWDLLALKELTEALSDEGLEIEDSGFELAELEQLIGEDQEIDHDEMWQGMPEFEQDDLSGIKMTVHFENVEDIIGFAELIGQKLTEKTKSFWHPYKEQEDLKAMSYENES